MSLTRESFVPQKQPILEPRLRKAGTPIETPPRASRARGWGKALLVTIAVTGVVAYIALLIVLVVKGYLPGDFVPNKP